MYNYAFFQKLEKNLQQKPNADICKVLHSFAGNDTCVNLSCYALSCLACCCCTKCAGTCLTNADMGGFWKDALQLYTNKTVSQKAYLFNGAMNTIRAIENRLRQQLQYLHVQTKSDFQSGDFTNHTLSSLKYEIARSKLNDGSWMKELMYRVRSYMVQYNHPDKMVEVPIETTELGYEEFRTLIASIGMLYPMCFKPILIFPLTDMDKSIIRSAIEDTLAAVDV